MKENVNQQAAKAPSPTRSTSTIFKFIFLAFSVVVLVIALNTFFNNSSTSSSWAHGTRHPEIQSDEELDLPSGWIQLPSGGSVPPNNCSLPTTRYDINSGQAACYPSSGGIWMTIIGPLELQYLDINRFESTERSWDQAEEDRLCRELRKFGGEWYKPESGDELWSSMEKRGCTEVHKWASIFKIYREVGFPEERGILVLTVSKETGRYPKGTLALRNALTMEERCRVLERLGAVFCEDIASCPVLSDLRKEPCKLAEEKASTCEITWEMGMGLGWRDNGGILLSVRSMNIISFYSGTRMEFACCAI
ncbi:hypothetical protein BBP40_009261 [Aspergillus hancockii]|nr:hypothetical protein BBP40_009261 [Aspergillus hancockii]